MNVYQKLNEIRKQVHYVKKDANVQNQYKAVSHDAVTALVREHLVEHGVMVVPSLESSSVADTGTKTSKGVPIIRYEGKYKVAFINADEPSDLVTVMVEAHANDQGDKAPGKAVSYATKYAMLKVFSIETGEGDESRLEAVPVSYTEEHKAMFDSAIAEGDSFGLVALLGLLSEEAQTGLFNSFGKNAKSSGKETVRSMQKEGLSKWDSAIIDVEGMIESEDGVGLKQLVSELTKHEKHYLAKRLGDRKSQDMGNLIREIAA